MQKESNMKYQSIYIPYLVLIGLKGLNFYFIYIYIFFAPPHPPKIVGEERFNKKL